MPKVKCPKCSRMVDPRGMGAHLRACEGTEPGPMPATERKHLLAEMLTQLEAERARLDRVIEVIRQTLTD